MLVRGLAPTQAHSFDTAAADVAQGCAAVYRTYLQEVIAVHDGRVAKKTRGGEKTATKRPSTRRILHRAAQPLPLPRPAKVRMPTAKVDSKIKCRKCKSRRQMGVLRTDIVVRSVDEGMGVRFDCLDELCSHYWIRK
jgi:ribosomal protein L44E